MAEKVELKERGTNKPIYPITLDECVLDSNGNSIKLKVNNSITRWSALIEYGSDKFEYIKPMSGMNGLPLDISKFKEGDYIELDGHGGGILENGIYLNIDLETNIPKITTYYVQTATDGFRIISKNSVAIDKDIEKKATVWTAEPVIIEGAEMYAYGGNYGENPLDMSKYKDGDIIKVVYGGLADSNHNADDLFFTGITSGNIMFIMFSGDIDNKKILTYFEITKDIDNNAILMSGMVGAFTTLSEFHNHSEDVNKHVPSGGKEGQLLLWQSIGRAKWGDLSEIFSYNPTDFLAYGVEWDVTVADPHITRIGNMSLHKTLPIQSQLKGCIALGGKVMYWLNEDDWRFRKYPKIIEGGLDSSGDVTLDESKYSVESLGVGLFVKINNKTYSIESIDIPNNSFHVRVSAGAGDFIGEIEIGSRLDGYDGTVRVYCPKFYIKSESDGNKRRVWISTTRIDDSWHEQPSVLIDAWHCTVLNEVPENMGYLSTLQVNSAVSIRNTSTYCRGGSNNPSYDLYLSSDFYRTSLGKPRTSLPRATMRTYTGLTDSHVLSYNEYKNIFYWLYVIEYANFNCQEAFNQSLTSEGYHLGGLGPGITGISGWKYYNSYLPIIPCGFMSLLYGNKTSSIITNETKPYTITVPSILNMNSFIVSSGTGTKENGKVIITNIKTTSSNTLYADADGTSINTTYLFTGLTAAGVSALFYSGGTKYGEISEDGTVAISWPRNINSREIRFSAVKSNINITIEVTDASSGTINVASLSILIPTWRGFLNPFGDIWNNLDGIIIDADANNHSNNMDYVYTCLDPEKFADTLTEDYIKVGEAIHLEGYIKEFDLGDDASIFPNAIGGNTTLYKCDYRWPGDKNTTLRTLIVGGYAAYGAAAGLGDFISSYGVSYSWSGVGFRSVSRFLS